MRHVGQGAKALCALVVVGCSAGSNLTTRGQTVRATSLSSRATRPERVTGSATILLPLFGNAQERGFRGALHVPVDLTYPAVLTWTEGAPLPGSGRPSSSGRQVA